MGSVLRLRVLFFLSFLLLHASNTWSETFHHCLVHHSQPSHPISEAIFTPKNTSYSSTLQAYIRNLRFMTSTTPKPLLIITALDESHVQVAVLCAQIHNLQMKIRSGGHDYEGSSYVSDAPFFILDMFNLRAVTVDIETEKAWVQSGAILGELYYKIAEKSKLLGFPAGVAHTVGVGGHISGGGYGSMMRKYGLSVDNIIDAKLVDAKGKLLDRKSMGEDLFWAIRGGGGASFGVIVAYKIILVPVPERVTVFKVERTLEQNATDIFYQYQQIADTANNDLFIRVTLDVFRRIPKGKKTVRATFLCQFLGESKTLVSLMNKILPELGLQPSDCIEMSWIKSVLFFTNFPLGTPVEALLSRTPQVRTHFKRKSDYVKTPISKEGLNQIWEKMVELERPMFMFNPYGGRMVEIAASETPFPHRAGNLWKILYLTNWEEEGREEADHYMNLTRQLYNFMTPFVSKNPRSAFFNYKDLDLGINHNGKRSYKEGKAYGIKYFDQNFDKLVRIKTMVDPDNFFRNEQSIPTLSTLKEASACDGNGDLVGQGQTTQTFELLDYWLGLQDNTTLGQV